MSMIQKYIADLILFADEKNVKKDLKSVTIIEPSRKEIPHSESVGKWNGFGVPLFCMKLMPMVI